MRFTLLLFLPKPEKILENYTPGINCNIAGWKNEQDDWVDPFHFEDGGYSIHIMLVY